MLKPAIQAAAKEKNSPAIIIMINHVLLSSVIVMCHIHLNTPVFPFQLFETLI